MNVLVVESPAKAKTINKYLGKDFHVLASMGHVRDLTPKSGSVLPDDDFAMVWEVTPGSEKNISAIAKALKGAKTLYLATDPDREGEAISWHLYQELEKRGKLKGVDVKRVVFHEITKDAIKHAMDQPRSLDQHLIEAYLARRSLDYLFGFTLSPILWRKLPGSKSAGRVQSVALRLVCDRELEIEDFKPQEYWTVDAHLLTPAKKPFVAHLTHLKGQKLDKFGLPDEKSAQSAVDLIQKADLHVATLEHKKVRRNPYAPFITSTLQQDAIRKLHFSAKQTMSLAQRLYEGVDLGGETVGLITYMRTDSVHLAPEAVSAIRNMIGKDYGASYLPAQPNTYQTKTKNAQEAHEAIRPTDVTRTPRMVAPYLDKNQLKLYELIWQRTVASQMSPAQLDQVGVDLVDQHKHVQLRSTGSVVSFDGFLKVYQEAQDDDDDKEENRRLPPLKEGEKLVTEDVKPDQHFTQPPPRYTEASLVKKLEELGIGRPSTYASILSVLQERDYVRLDKRRFIPEDRGRIVTAFLKNYFTQYVAYDFTAELEDELDEIANHNLKWKKVLKDFWVAFDQHIKKSGDLQISDILNHLDEVLAPHFFPQTKENPEPRKCPNCQDGRLHLKLGKYGGFIGCSNYPTCDYARHLTVAHQEPDSDDPSAVTKTASDLYDLGADPKTGLHVSVRKGPYGYYIQSGDGPKPHRVSVPKGVEPSTVDLKMATQYLTLPRTLGEDPETKQEITAAIGRYGPYVKRDRTFVSIPHDQSVLTIDLKAALELLKTAKVKDAAEEIGVHPKDKKSITLHSGRYGPYLKHGKTMASIPKDMQDKPIKLQQAIDLINAKEGTPKKKISKKRS